MYSNEPLFLGLDLSTQQLKGVLINCHKQVVDEITVSLVDEFPEFATTNGRYVDGDVVTAPVLMWVAAVDTLMARLAASGFAQRICGISGAAQQHGSVYWRQQGVEALQQLDSKLSLRQQLEDSAFAVLNSPIWEDSSTGKQCRELEQHAGGAWMLAHITGSTAFERFTGPQIAKLKETQPDAWSTVSRISLVSSFIASLLIGNVAPIDCSDATGTNIYDVQKKEWSQELCDFIDPRLKQVLGARVVMATSTVGQLSPYFAQRYGMAQCPVVAFTGDNPSAFAGFESLFATAGHSAAVISLGTSDTVLFPLSAYPYVATDPLKFQHPDGHVLQHPTKTNEYVAMLCYKNGSLARDWVRERSLGASSSWVDFSSAANIQPMVPNALGFYYLATEILPYAKGVFRFEKCSEGDLVCPSGAKYKQVEAFSAINGNDARAIIESQFMSMCVDYRRKEAGALTGVAITGGASRNQAIQQAISDILGVPVFAAGIQTNKGVDKQALAMPAYGGAIRALNQLDTAVNSSSKPKTDSAVSYVLERICSPNNNNHAVYAQALADFEFLRDFASRTSSTKQTLAI
ncbi:hypothetical protein LPJ55_002662 [Coemansia sp. RSA 990]|nr:hypothetical protein LPJ55_002662 [Coemansia sp. RSA 990]